MELFAILWLIGCPIICAVIANSKGRSGCIWSVAGFVFGIFAVILVIALPADKENLDEEYVRVGYKKVCPYCAETILAAAKVCRYCGRDVVETESSQVELTKPCPFCAKPIRQEAVECRHCGREWSHIDLPKSY